MSESKSLGKELLKQDGLTDSEMIPQERQKLEELLRSERRRCQMLYRMAAIALALFLIVLVVPAFLSLLSVLGIEVMANLYDKSGEFLRALNILGLAAAVMAIGFGLLAWVRDRSAYNKELSIRLADVELLLRKQSDDPSGKSG